MKLKKILSGFLAAAMAVTTMVTASVTAGAAETTSYINVKGNTASWAMNIDFAGKTFIQEGTNTYDLSFTNDGTLQTEGYKYDDALEALAINFYDLDEKLEDISLLYVTVGGVKKDITASAEAKSYLWDGSDSVPLGYTIELTEAQMTEIGTIAADSTITFTVSVTYDTTPAGGSKWTKKAVGEYKFISAEKPSNAGANEYGSGDICPDDEAIDLSDLLPTGKTLADIRKIKVTASVGSYQSFNGAIGTNIITATEPTGEWAAANCKVDGTGDPSTTAIAELETPLGVADGSTLKLQSYYMNYSTTINVKIEVEVAEAVLHTITVTAPTNGTVTPDKDEAEAGETVTLTVTPAEGYELDTLTVATSTAGTDTVTVAADNTFTMPDDDVTVTATFKKAEVALTGITLNKTTVVVLVGSTTTLTATKVPATTNDETAITWASDTPAVATVSASGVVTGVKAGTATITATCGTKTATCTVTVTEDATPCTGVTLDKTTAEVLKGETITLTATAAPENTTDEITWESSNTGVATVTNGVVTGVSRGIANITVKCGDKTATCKVSVNEEETISGTTPKVFQSAVTDGKYNENDVLVISAADVAAAKSVTITVTDNTGKKTTKEITECYQKVTYTAADGTTDTITAGANYLLAVTVTGIPEGTTVTVTAAVNK